MEGKKIFVRVKTRAKQERVEQIDETHFMVAVNAAPVGGRANDAVTKALADFLGTSQSCLALVSGHTGRDKIFMRF